MKHRKTIKDLPHIIQLKNDYICSVCGFKMTTTKNIVYCPSCFTDFHYIKYEAKSNDRYKNTNNIEA